MTESAPLPILEGVSLSAPGGLGCAQSSAGNLPLRVVDVRARVTGLDVETDLMQVFVNDRDTPLEVTYMFPLPPRAAVDHFEAQLGGRRIAGVLKERGQARADFAAAVSEGKRAALAEEERPDLFTVTIGNLMPGEEAHIHLSMVAPLSCRDGEVTLRIPLVTPPRYIPGAPLSGPSAGQGTASDTDAVPDASRITPPVLLPGMPSPVQLSIEVEIEPAGLNIQHLTSSLHGAMLQREGDRYRVTLSPGERLDRDFLLRFTIDEQDIQTSMSAVRDDQGSTFQCLVIPPTLSTVPRPRDIVFVLDRSGSMSGWKMVAARRAVEGMVAALSPRDRYCVMAFDNIIEYPDDQTALTAATDAARFKTEQYLSKLMARGGTEMARPLQRAAELLSDPDRDRQLVLITDGQVGNEKQILLEMKPRLKGIRVCTVGIDRAVNEGFLRGLADRGAFELVESAPRLETVMGRLERLLGSPVLVGLRLEASGLDTDTLLPDGPIDLFAGVPVVLRGRLTGDARVATLSATDSRGQPWTQTLTIAEVDEPSLSVMWARGQVRKLEDRFLVQPEEETRQALISISLTHHVLCQFTAFVAIDDEQVNPDGDQAQVTQPHERPEGWAVPAAMPPIGGNPARAGAFHPQMVSGFGGGRVPRPGPVQHSVEFKRTPPSRMRSLLIRLFLAGVFLISVLAVVLYLVFNVW